MYAPWGSLSLSWSPWCSQCLEQCPSLGDKQPIPEYPVNELSCFCLELSHIGAGWCVPLTFLWNVKWTQRRHPNIEEKEFPRAPVPLAATAGTGNPISIFQRTQASQLGCIRLCTQLFNCQDTFAMSACLLIARAFGFKGSISVSSVEKEKWVRSLNGKNSGPPSSLQRGKLQFYMTHCSGLKTAPPKSCPPGPSEWHLIWKQGLGRLD